MTASPRSPRAKLQADSPSPSSPELDRPAYDRSAQAKARGPVEAWLAARLRDPRDLPAVRTALEASACVIPFAIYLFTPGAINPWTVAAYYMINFVFFLDRFVLMMHVGVHRPWFGREHRFLNNYVPNVLGLFFGQSISTYFAHHVVMHHAQDNGPDDLSSTRGYRRDRLSHLLRYVGRFLLVGVPSLALYFLQRGQRRWARKVALGELATWAIVALAAWVNWQAALVVFVVPIFFTRTMMMLGNWAQHAFVDPAHPQSPYGLSTNIINSRHNLRCFNNGYHIVHHARPALHWSELPQEFVDNLESYTTNEAVIFEGVASFQLLALALVCGRYAWLESRLLRLPGDTRSVQARIDFLRSRTGVIA